MVVDQIQLKEFVLDSGLVPKQVVEDSLIKAKATKKKLGDILLSDGHLSEDDLRRVQAYILGIPFISLKGKHIDFDTLSLIPEPIARTNNIVAFKKQDKELEVAMLDTDDLRSIEFIKKKTGLKILPRLTDVNSIKDALLQYQKTLKDEFGDIIKRESETLAVVSENSGEEVSGTDLKKLAEDLPVVRIVNALLKHAILQNASDIHVEPMEETVLVRYRIDGILHDAMSLPKSAGPSITARIKVLSNLKLDEKRLPQDGRFKMKIDDEKVSFRVSVLPVYYGEKTVMRLLREGGGGYTLESLGFHGNGLEKIHEATRRTVGMILTTGPTGSGKTTTLYTILDIVNTPEVNISTIEDPIEYQMQRVNQTQVKPQIGFTFSEGLRSLVRQDPDIIMVGEIRDGETASLAVNAALTGHLVLSTLHTNSAAGAIPRLIEMGAEAFLLVSTLDVVIAQRLVRKFTKEKEEYNLTKAEVDNLAVHANIERVMKALHEEGIVDKKITTLDKVPFFRPKKGKEEDAYKGRIGIHEILSMSSKIRDLIMEGKDADHIEQQARTEGMLTMLEDGIFKSAQGITSIEEVLRVISE